MALTPRKLKFVQVYDGNAKEAAIAAGWSEATAKQAGHRAMQDVEVLEAIQAREGSELAPAIATRKERQAFWTAQMRDPDAELRERLKASELLGRSEADFTEKMEVKGELTLRDLVSESRLKAAPTSAPIVPGPEAASVGAEDLET